MNPDAASGPTREARIGTAVANAVSAACVVAIVVVLQYLAANALAVVRSGDAGEGAPRPVGPGFSPNGVNAALTAFVFVLPLLGSSGIAGLLARGWTYGIIRPAFHMGLALVAYLPLLFLTTLLPLGFVVYFFPFPILAAVVLGVWSSTLRAIRDASEYERDAVRLRVRRRIDRAVVVAVGIQVLFPLALIRLSAIGIGA